MPCSDGGQDEHWNEMTYGIHASSATIATKVACEFCKLARQIDPVLRFYSPLVRKWCKEHEKQDEKS